MRSSASASTIIATTIARSLGVALEVIDEQLVDLHEVEGEIPQVGERRVPRAEGVQADLHAGVSQGTRTRHRGVRCRHEDAFGHLDIQAAPWDAMGVERFDHGLLERGVGELSRGDEVASTQRYEPSRHRNRHVNASVPSRFARSVCTSSGCAPSFSGCPTSSAGPRPNTLEPGDPYRYMPSGPTTVVGYAEATASDW